MDASKLNALGTIVAEVDGESPEAQQQAAEQAQADAQLISDAEAWAVLPAAIGKLVCMVAPELKAVYTKEACLAWGESMAPVAQKYGWNGPDGLPELGLAMATVGLAVPSYMVLKVKLAEFKKAAATASPDDAAATTVVTVQPSPAEVMRDGG